MKCAVTVTKKVKPKAKQMTSQMSLPDAQALKKKKAAENLRRWRENRSQAKKDADKAKINAANANKKEESEENRRKFSEANKLAMKRCKEKKSDEQRDEDRQKDRERKKTDEKRQKDRERKKTDEVRRSDRLRKNRAKEEMDEDQLAVELEKNRMYQETHKRVKKTKTTMKDGLRNTEILEGSFPVKRLEETADAIGGMDVRCQHCGAFKFKREPEGFCCSSGKVKTAPFPKPPGRLSELWASNGAEGNLLKKFSREINNAVALSSIKVTEKTFRGFTPTVIFQGQLKHLAGALLPAEGEVPRYAQLYCFDPRLESTQRFENMYVPQNTSRAEKEGLKKLLQSIETIIHEHNPFVKDFKMIMELPEDELAQGKIVISAKEKPSDEHTRRYNLQSNFNEVSILTNEAPHDLVLQKRGGGLCSIHDLNPKGMPFHFTLLFPFGTRGWDQDEKQVGGKRRITTKQFYVFHLQMRDNGNLNYLMSAGRLFQEFCCMMWVSIENQRLNYQRFNQKALRADSYKSVREATEERIRDAGPRSDQIFQDDHQSNIIGRKILAGTMEE